MREQIISPRTSGRAGPSSGRRRSAGVVQKPARRGGKSQSQGSRIRIVMSYLPLVGKVMLAIITGVIVFATYRAAASASFFEPRRVDIGGTMHVSIEQVNSVVRLAVAKTGVLGADLQAISNEVEKLPWVRTAIVSRVLPDGLRVRVTERVPRAVVRMESGKFVWVDDDAVSLSQMSPADQMPAFFIRGWDEAGPSEARAENRDRVKKYLEMTSEWTRLGLSDRVSEVNLGDLHDIRALLAGSDAQIEVRLGDRNLGTRLQNVLKELDVQRATPVGPFITYFEASQDGKIIFGHSAGAPTDINGRAQSTTDTRSETKNRSADGARSGARTAPERNKNQKSASDTNKETRPRRVG